MRILRGLGRGTAALGLAAACAGCTDSVESFGPHAAPTAAAQCVDLPHAKGDPGILLGTDWSGEHHDYAQTAVVHACVTASLGGRVRLTAYGTGIRVRPRVAVVDPSGSGIVPFRVTVGEGASGGLRVQQEGDGGGGDLPGPVVAVARDGWHFVSHG